MKLIDAEELLEHIDFVHFMEEHCLDEREIVEIIKMQPQVNQWIPCKERLPKENGWYLVTLNDGAVDIDQFFESESCWRGFVGLGNETIAWMPLPKAYEEK